MNKRKSPIGIKIIACLLLLGSLACCLLPWMKISIDVGVEQERMNPGELIQTFLGMDAAAAQDNAIAALRGEGVPFDAEALTTRASTRATRRSTACGSAATARCSMTTR